jgi:hypothetical protein
MDRDMVGFIALDQILGRFSRSVMHVSLEPRVGGDLLGDDSANAASLGIPSHVVADVEHFRH